MKIITGARQIGKTTELIKEAYRTHSRIVCTSKLHCKSIEEIACKLQMQIKPPITIKKLMQTPQNFRLEKIAIDEVLYCLFHILPTFDVTCVTLGYENNQEFQHLEFNEVPESQQKTLEQELAQCHSELDSESKKLKAKEQECEELKKYKAVVENLAGKQIILTNKDKMPELYENAKDLMLDRYKQALEKIEQIAKYGYSEDDAQILAFSDFVNYRKILDIINEVKDANI